MTDWADIAPTVALALLGEPKTKTGREWRWGSNGALSLNLAHGTWHDFEAGVGGGVLSLVERERQLRQVRGASLAPRSALLG